MQFKKEMKEALKYSGASKKIQKELCAIIDVVDVCEDCHEVSVLNSKNLCVLCHKTKVKEEKMKKEVTSIIDSCKVITEENNIKLKKRANKLEEVVTRISHRARTILHTLANKGLVNIKEECTQWEEIDNTGLGIKAPHWHITYPTKRGSIYSARVYCLLSGEIIVWCYDEDHKNRVSITTEEGLKNFVVKYLNV